MNEKELGRKLLTVKEVIGVMREAGTPDSSIIKQFGLNPTQLGTSTLRLYKAIKDGKVKEDDTLVSIAATMGWNSHNAVLYHLKKLKENGYIS